MSNPILDDDYADKLYVELGGLEIQLDNDPLAYGPKRLNGKVAESRRMLSRCEQIFLDVSMRQAQFKRSHLRAQTGLELAKKHLLAHDPEVRAGRNVADRDAIACVKLRTDVEEVARLDRAVQELDALLTVIRAKRADLRDTQGRLRDQVRLCQEEIGLGGRWGSKSPRGVELEPNQGVATGKDIEEMDEVVAVVSAAVDSERHLPAEVDLSDDPSEVDALLQSADAVLPDEDEPLVEDEPPAPVPQPKAATPFEDLPLTGTRCSVCGKPQRRAPGGEVCENGHGGAAPLLDGEVPEEADALEPGTGDVPSAADALPSATKVDDVDGFLEGLDVRQTEKKKPRRQLEEETALDIDSLLANFGS